MHAFKVDPIMQLVGFESHSQSGPSDYRERDKQSILATPKEVFFCGDDSSFEQLPPFARPCEGMM